MTALQGGPKEKLLGKPMSNDVTNTTRGAYRLYWDGTPLATGPGRGVVATTEGNHTGVDVIDVTDQASSASTVTVAIQVLTLLLIASLMRRRDITISVLLTASFFSLTSSIRMAPLHTLALIRLGMLLTLTLSTTPQSKRQ